MVKYVNATFQAKNQFYGYSSLNMQAIKGQT